MTDAEKLKLLLDYYVNLDLICALQRTYLDDHELYKAYISYVSYDASLISENDFYTVCEMLIGWKENKNDK